ncbi:DUF479 domain-containing protein [Azoarcus sp. TTM-91]|uniref:ACP phosphodiesterase n=1 Tax=Azoarcus sp. TTM-91 TaxID=2691581 RepID=UPI00145CEABE|nr:DUF479 domain-containing protein [Azoarcus sp. TTM-91]
MNFLAHAYLAGPADADRVGGVIGDFVKGRLDPPPAGYSAELLAGVALHRRIDSYADAHPAFRRSRERVSPARRRVAGIMVDMFYDHFLALRWPSFSAQPLEAFAADSYRLLNEQTAGLPLPPVFFGMLRHMVAEDWFSAYRQPARIARALDGMAEHRLRQPNPLAGAGEELLAHYAGFEADCLAFLADAAVFTAGLRTAR